MFRYNHAVFGSIGYAGPPSAGRILSSKRRWHIQARLTSPLSKSLAAQLNCTASRKMNVRLAFIHYFDRSSATPSSKSEKLFSLSFTSFHLLGKHCPLTITFFVFWTLPLCNDSVFSKTYDMSNANSLSAYYHLTHLSCMAVLISAPCFPILRSYYWSEPHFIENASPLQHDGARPLVEAYVKFYVHITGLGLIPSKAHPPSNTPRLDLW